MNYYKWLDGRKSCNGGDAWWRKGAWKTVMGRLEPCRNGLHLCREQDLLSWIGPTLWLAEVDDSELIDHQDKIVVRRARIVEQLAWDDKISRLFAADCAERVLSLFEKIYSNDDRPRKAIEAARAFARGEISAVAWAAARDAARAATRDAARAAASAEAWDAARAAASAEAWDAAWAATSAEAWDAAWDAAWAAASATARDAARAATWNAARAATRDAASATARDAAWDAEREWQTARLLDYAQGRIK